MRPLPCQTFWVLLTACLLAHVMRMVDVYKLGIWIQLGSQWGFKMCTCLCLGPLCLQKIAVIAMQCTKEPFELRRQCLRNSDGGVSVQSP